MTAIHVEGMNLTLAPPRSLPDGTTCTPLMAWKEEGPDRITTVWELSHEELWQIITTRRLYLTVLGHQHPPVALQPVPG